MESLRIVNATASGVSADGQTLYVHARTDDPSRPEVELQLVMPTGAGALISALLSLATAAHKTTQPDQARRQPKLGIVQVAPTHVGFRLSGPGRTVMGMQYGQLHLTWETTPSQLGPLAAFLGTQAAQAGLEPGAVQ